MKKTLSITLVIVLLFFAYLIFYLNNNSFIITGYAAKKACGCHLISGRSLESIKEEDLADFPLSLVKLSANKDSKEASASLFGLWKSTVYLSEKLGCILSKENPNILDGDIDRVTDNWKSKKKNNANTVGLKKLDAAYKLAFDQKGEDQKKTRALLVFHQNKLLKESYAEGFDQNTRILGWSMNKSIASTLVGILAKNNMIDLNEDHLFEEWKADKRKNITINDLLQMQSGLDWNEEYAERDDATMLLFEEENCSQFAINKELEADPGSYWEYSSGTSNIISKIIRDRLKNDELYWSLPYDSLFYPLGMNSMVLDTDKAGNYILSSYGYATPRDWGKFGLLYLNRGVINEKKIINEEWIDYTLNPAHHAVDKEYGAHFWLNAGGVYPDVPKDMYSCNGYQGQYIFIIPSLDLVVVRMGLTSRSEFDMNPVLQLICESVAKS